MGDKNNSIFKKAILKNIVFVVVGFFLILLTLNTAGTPIEFFKLHMGNSKSIGNIAIGLFIGIFFLIVGVNNILKLVREKKNS